MSKSNDSNEDEKSYMDCFFPCFEGITKEYGLTTSAVFGNIWRKAQGKGYSFASHQTIGKDLKIGLKTVQRAINKLLELNLIIQLDSSKLRRPSYIDKRTISYTWNEDLYKEKYWVDNKNDDEENFSKLNKEERQALFSEKKVVIDSIDSGQLINDNGQKINEVGYFNHNLGVNGYAECARSIGSVSLTNIEPNIQSNTETNKQFSKEINQEVNTRDKIGSASDFVSSTPTEDSSLSGEPVIDFNEDWGIPESNTKCDELPESLRLTNELMKKYADSVNQHYDY